MDDETARLIHYMPIIVRDGDITAWERKFCASIIFRNRSGAFRPSQAQVLTMARIVRAFQNRAMRQDHAAEWQVVG